jgi:hypothetical protein
MPLCPIQVDGREQQIQCASRISKRSCSSFLKVFWFGVNASWPGPGSVATLAFLNTLVTRLSRRASSGMCSCVGLQYVSQL